jgi:hypothetical protein
LKLLVTISLLSVAPFAKIIFLIFVTVLMHSMLYSKGDAPLFCVMWLLLAISFHLSFAIPLSTLLEE